ncbi:glycoside hydrolase family 3 N-terminal domain-containing protein [Aestuariivivens sediminis]|uniref:glycoside hydrolase family 3 N-terminal domain-containing protein n=1 Tax=Aestuariivivens sediminis TaxID=2913557 RepID=UPI001F561639|nr:glycoside hydrolase family 3 N-terminal domain-containing protein [Aestuariivivens sediminis]
MRYPLLILPSIFFLLCLSPIYSQKWNRPIYKDANAPIEDRIKDLLSRMTITDKARQIDIYHAKALNISDRKILNREFKTMGDTLSRGIGFLQFDTQLPIDEYRANFNAIQKYFIEETELGIPAISNGEGCHGFVGAEGTVFPVPLSMGSTWNKDLIEAIYTAIGKEMRLYGITHAATPVLDLLRDPRYGRCDELYGEDPFLVAEIGVAAIFGIQGRYERIGPNHLIATAKHFGAHGEPEGGTNLAPVNLSERVLRETHFYPFERIVKDANVRSVMASYNEIDGVPSHGNSWLLNDILRREWGFTGYVISDYDAVRRMIYRQHVVHDKKEAAERALTSGMDFECPSGRDKYCFRYLPQLIKEGSIKEAVLDLAVARVLRNKFLMGLFEQPYVKEIPKKERLVFQEDHRKLALKAAEQGMILLKNDNNTLPLDKAKIKKLAVIGANADEVHYGTYSNVFKEGVSILEGIKTYANGEFEVHYAEGFQIYENDTLLPASEKTAERAVERLKEAVALAEKCDTVILVLGGNEFTCREGWAEDHTGDRVDLTLLGGQDELTKQILEVNKNTSVLLINGRPLAINYVTENVPAIIEGWYLGQEQGTAVANILFGEVNPSGKLTVTIPKSVGQLPVYYNHKPIVHERSFVEGTYDPLYYFGFGLSYTKFEYSNIKLSKSEANIGELVTISVDVTNVGNRAGDEIVQMYIRDKVSSVTRPMKELKGFERISLKRRETKTVTFTIDKKKLHFFDLAMNRVVEPGEFDIMVGPNSQELITRTLRIKNK